MTYYAVALTPNGRIGQLRVTRKGSQMSQSWTGVIYATQKQAIADLTRLNA